MKVRNRIKRKTVLWIIPIGVVLLIYACHHVEKEKVLFPPVYVAKHTLMTLSPDFTMEADSTALYKQYLRLRTGKEFPMIGVLRVNGKSYRFIGGDSLRIAPIASIYSGEGWSGKYSYLYESLSLISLIISLLGSAITSFCTFSLYSSGSIILMLISNSAKSGKRGISE